VLIESTSSLGGAGAAAIQPEVKDLLQGDGVATHEVINQVPILQAHVSAACDQVLQSALAREGAAWSAEQVEAFARRCATPEVQDWARLANRILPELKTHDRLGHRIDFVEYHPAYHELMKLSFGAGVHSLAWTDTRKGSHVARAALSYIWNQVENGTACPTGMNYSALPAIAATPGVGPIWAPKITANGYDPRPVPMEEKQAVTIGMTLTEKQGGSDLRANTTQARAVSGRGPGEVYELTGHKWFCSAPMCDAFYTLAQTDKGPTCFLVPRFLPDGRRNRFFIQRLKDKLGNRSNASSEIEYRRTFAWAMSEEGKGVRAAIDMIHLTRLDFAMGSAGLMRQALTQALHHTSHRNAFGKRLVDQPLMANVLADLAVDSEAATTIAFRLARAADEGIRGDKKAALLERIGTSVTKYWNCKRAAGFIHEALECHGGNGFVEEHVMPRLYREAPLNSVWEGSGNVIVLDIARVMKREPDAIPVFLDEIGLARGADRRFDRYFDRLKDRLSRCGNFELEGRQLVESLALAFQASMLVRHSTPEVADAFCASRLDGDWGRFFGTLPAGIDCKAIVERARTLPV